MSIGDDSRDNEDDGFTALITNLLPQQAAALIKLAAHADGNIKTFIDDIHAPVAIVIVAA